jgi:hypothetical protein
MKMRIWSAVCVVTFGALTIGLAAQAPGAQTSPQSTGTANHVMLTGCVQKAAPAPTATTGAIGSANADATTYTLTNVTTTPSSAGTPAAGSGMPPASTYRLDAQDSQIAPHVGHKVEINGTLVPGSTSSLSTASKEATGPQVKVESLRMIASSCS